MLEEEELDEIDNNGNNKIIKQLLFIQLFIYNYTIIQLFINSIFVPYHFLIILYENIMMFLHFYKKLSVMHQTPEIKKKKKFGKEFRI